MKKLTHNQEGIAHILVILVFVLAIGGIAGFSYMRIHDKDKPVASTSQAAGDDSEESDDNVEVGDGTDSVDDTTAALTDEVDNTN